MSGGGSHEGGAPCAEDGTAGVMAAASQSSSDRMGEYSDDAIQNLISIYL